VALEVVLGAALVVAAVVVSGWAVDEGMFKVVLMKRIWGCRLSGMWRWFSRLGFVEWGNSNMRERIGRQENREGGCLVG